MHIMHIFDASSRTKSKMYVYLYNNDIIIRQYTLQIVVCLYVYPSVWMEIVFLFLLIIFHCFCFCALLRDDCKMHTHTKCRKHTITETAHSHTHLHSIIDNDTPQTVNLVLPVVMLMTIMAK